MRAFDTIKFMNRRMLRCVLSLFAMGPGLAVSGVAQANFELKDGDRVVFYGDSVTQAQPGYPLFIEGYVMTRFPHLHVWFANSGMYGDTVSGGETGSIDVRLQRDVIDLKPTVVTVMLGLNDGATKPWDDARFATFAAGYKHIVDSLRRALPEARIFLLLSSPYDDVTRPPDFKGGYNAVLTKYNQFVKSLGQREHLTVVDVNRPLMEMLKMAKASNPQVAREIIPDRIHPGPGGHLIIAQSLLQAWNAPGTVAAVEIDAGAKRLVRADNAEVTDLHFGSSVTWTETDRAIPFQVGKYDDASEFAMQNSGFIDALDKEPLKVTGLEGRLYSIAIDGEVVGKCTGQQLREGINLAVVGTPMVKQSLAVYVLTVRHDRFRYWSWREIHIELDRYNLPHERAVVDGLDKLDDDILQAARISAQPKPRHYTLTPE